MKNLEILLKDITNKDEKKAQEAADYLINSADIELFKMLVAKSDFLFDFVKQNVIKRLSKAINHNNFKNIFKFFEEYSTDYDEFFADVLAKNADEDLTDEILEFLEKGSIAQKTYAAKYFSYIPDTVAIDLLSKYAFNDDESLSYNCAEALGQMHDETSFRMALGSLNTDDDFEKLKAIKFFVAYGKDYPFKEIFNAMKSSKMPENIAGQIPYMVDFIELFKSKFKSEAFDVLDNILVGLGEILPVSDVFQFELYEILEQFINKPEEKDKGIIAKILLKAYSKFKLFVENQEYIFDETKETKQEINAIFNLLQAQNKDFWTNQKQYLVEELKQNKNEILSILPVVGDYKIVEAVSIIKENLNTEDEIVVCEKLSTLKQLDALNDIDIDSIAKQITNSNIKAIIENLK